MDALFTIIAVTHSVPFTAFAWGFAAACCGVIWFSR